jgi:hypothetical protein
MTRAAIKLLAELTARGVQVEARAGRLRYWPRSALTPHLTEQLKQHKAALLALLTGENDRPGVVPHEPSLAERVAAGYVNPGWHPSAWADRLEQLAARCERLRPRLAAEYRDWAANVRKAGKYRGP